MWISDRVEKNGLHLCVVACITLFCTIGKTCRDFIIYLGLLCMLVLGRATIRLWFRDDGLPFIYLFITSKTIYKMESKGNLTTQFKIYLNFNFWQ